MKTSLVIIGLVVVIVIAAGAYYTLSINSRLSSSNHPNIPVVSSLTTQKTTAYTTSIQPKSTSSSSSSATTTVAQNATTTIVSNSPSSYTVNVSSSQSLGTYLTNGTGYTLYYFSGDKANSDLSNCNGTCASDWPPFYTSTLSLPAALSASSFNTITRSDGTKQLTYNGLPLYFFKSDTKSGEVSGNGVGGFVVASAAGS